MKSKNLVFITALALCFRGSLHLATSVRTNSDYAKVARYDGGETTKRNFTTESEPENLSQAQIEYEDFDDLQEQPKALNQLPSSNDFVKYFSGLISLLTLMYRFNGKVNAVPQKNINDKMLTHPRRTIQEEGKGFDEAQDRFDFPQKKFKKTDKTPPATDQQFQPLENYPPYNPLTANTAETYGNDDKKTSYDVYDGQTSLTPYKTNGQTHQTYDVPYEPAKPAKQNTYDVSPWNLHPVYQSWTSKPSPTNQASNLDSYHTITSWDDDSQTGNGDHDTRQTWTGNPSSGYPVYNHDFDDHQHPVDSHEPHYHQIEPHPVDEDRVSKKPYSYYFLGRKLWYVPLLFSVYFIVYVGALVLKSIARHKIQFPEKVWNLHEDVYGHAKNRKQRKIDEITQNYMNAIDNIKNKFM